MKVLIFAAGLGTRLRPLTDTKPKALIEVGGKPLLEWLILKLKGEGFDDIVINVHYLGEQIVDFVKEKKNFGVKIEFSDESDLLRDTGGGIKHAERLLNDGEPFLVHNVDIVSNLNLRSLYDDCAAGMDGEDCCHCGCDAGAVHEILASLIVSKRDSDRRLLFDSGNNLEAWENLKTGEVKSPFPELAAEKAGSLRTRELKPYAFAGIHVISPKIFELMKSLPEKFPIVDFYLSQADKYRIKGEYKEDLQLVDVGRVEHIEAAAELLRLTQGN
ncbi:MAG: nucleotidyltransferase family protein [Bacteroidales bacterium]|jgi:N-acetyl-alpha-D-muramate 1-phosphate uridylyltransferase|nr:nucleotidyltransferase family protein [Bacteroidales bacterium]MCI1734097.1 nucleotidyltransferase family protein [Bacteroidales bacterium]